MELTARMILEKYGSPVTLIHGSELVTVMAMIQPVRSKSWDSADREYSPLGEIPRGRYVYIGPVEPLPEVGDTLALEDKEYLVRRVELIYGPNAPTYCWGLCLEKGGVDTWGYQS